MPVLLTYFVMGFVDIVGVSTGYARRDFNLSPALAQIIPSMVFIWFLFLSVPFSVLQSRYGKKPVLLTGIILTAVGMLVPFIFYTYPMLLISFLFLGIGNTIIQVSSNPLLRDVTTAGQFSSAMSLSQLIKAISSLLGPILVTWAATGWGDWKKIFLVYGIISIVSAVWLFSTHVSETRAKEPSTFIRTIGLLKDRFVLTMVLAIFFLVGIDVGLNTNIQYFLQSRFSLSLENASLGISVYFFSLMASRFVGAIILSKVDNYRFFTISSLLTVLFIVLLMFSPSASVALVFIALTGLASGNLFPLIFALTVNKMPDKANEISGLMIMAVVGGALIPPLMGYIQNISTAIVSYVVLVGCSVYIYLSSLLYKKFSL